MTDPLRARIYELYAAFAQGRLDVVAQAFDEEVDFVSYAPIEVFPYLGRQKGKAALTAAMQRAHTEWEYLTYMPIFLVVDADDAAVIILARARQRASERIVHLFIADFLRFRDGRIAEMRQFLDSFDAVQQVFGREIDLSKI